jgi:hypothetical protein
MRRAAPWRHGETRMGHRMTQINTDEQKEHWACFRFLGFLCVHLCQSVAFISHDLDFSGFPNSSIHPGVSIFQIRKCLQSSGKRISKPVLSSMFLDFDAWIDAPHFKLVERKCQRSKSVGRHAEHYPGTVIFLGPTPWRFQKPRFFPVLARKGLVAVRAGGRYW